MTDRPRTSFAPGTTIEITTDHGRGSFFAAVVRDWWAHHGEEFITVTTITSCSRGFISAGETIDILRDDDTPGEIKIV